ncbi:MAG: hypothetical protein V3V97_16695 [Hyphomicrobiaceae bacterium]
MAGRVALKTKFCTKDMEYAFDCTKTHLHVLADREIIPKPDKGRWPVLDSMRGYIRYPRALRQGDADDVDGGGYREPGDKESDHRRRLTKARADLAEIEAAQAGGALVAVQQVSDVWCDIVANFRARALAVAHKAAPMVAVETDTDSCHATIEALIHEALAELANMPIVVLPGADGDGGGERAADGIPAAEAHG